MHRPDASSYRTTSRRTEQPGRYFHPLIATLVAGGGRLLLALAMLLVADRGGSYLCCDTDSLLIVATESGGLVACPGGPHRLPDHSPAVHALSWAQVRQLADQLGRLNPYRPPLDREPLLN